MAILAPVSAHADTACDSIDQLSHSVSLVRELSLEDRSVPTAAKLEKLERLTVNQRYDTFLSGEAKAIIPEVGPTIERFRDRVELAITTSNRGQSAIASDLFNSAISDTLSPSIVRLRRYWSCTSLDLNGQRALTPNVVPVLADRRSTQAQNTDAPTAKTSNEHSAASKRKNQTQKPRASSEPKGESNPLNLKNAPVLGTIIFVLVAIICILLWRSRQTKGQTKRAKRFALLFPIRIRQNGDRKPAKLVEISVSGCKIKHSVDDLDKRISIRLLDRILKARVVWANDHYAGLKFNKPIEFEQLNRIVRTARSGATAV